MRAVDVGVNAPDAVDEGETLTLDGWYTSGDGASSAPTLTVAWGDGVTDSYSLAENVSACVAYAVDHIYADDGSYAVAVTLYDDTGMDSDGTSVIVGDSFVPSLTFSLSDSDLTLGETVNLTGNYTVPGVSESVSLQIDWGDGTTHTASGTLNEIIDDTHAYSSEGSYDVAVTATDNSGHPSDETFVMLVAEVNQPPVANDDPGTYASKIRVPEDGPAKVVDVLANDTGNDLQIMSISSTGTTGLVTLHADGTITYDPNGKFEHLGNNETDTDTFAYTVTDGSDTATATVTVTITEVNDRPVVVNDAITVPVPEDTYCIIAPDSVLGNDEVGSPGEVGQTLEIYEALGASNGTAELLAGEIVFTPEKNFHGTAKVWYRNKDNGTTNGFPSLDVSEHYGTITVTVTPVNDCPTVADPPTQISIDEQQISLQIAGEDVDGDPFTFSASGLPPGLSIDPDSGLISGTIASNASQTNDGDYEVELTVQATGDICSMTTHFDWHVDAAPIVTISSTDQDAEEPTQDTASFTLTRTGDTSEPLTVPVSFSGAAQFGESPDGDFTLSESPEGVVIPAGASSVDVILAPTQNSDETDETVTITIDDGAGFQPGTPDSVTITIASWADHVCGDGRDFEVGAKCVVPDSITAEIEIIIYTELETYPKRIPANASILQAITNEMESIPVGDSEDVQGYIEDVQDVLDALEPLIAGAVEEINNAVREAGNTIGMPGALYLQAGIQQLDIRLFLNATGETYTWNGSAWSEQGTPFDEHDILVTSGWTINWRPANLDVTEPGMHRVFALALKSKIEEARNELLTPVDAREFVKSRVGAVHIAFSEDGT